MNKKVLIKSPEDVYKQFEFLKKREHEELWLLCINSTEITAKTMLSKGNKYCTVFDGALFAKKLLKSKYTQSVILVHNHPSGNKQFSEQDKDLTKKVKEICTLLDYNFLDHVVICREAYISYSDLNLK